MQVYGRTKAAGERYCLDLADGLVVRVPLLFGSGYALPRATFPEQAARSLRAGAQVMADDTETRQPTLTTDAARIISCLAAARTRSIVDVAPEEGITKLQWAVGIARQLGLDESLIRPARPAPGIPRPVRSWLQVRRLRELGISPPRDIGAATEAFFKEARIA